MSATNSFPTRLCLRSVVESAAEGEAPSEWMLLCLEQEAGGARLKGPEVSRRLDSRADL